ncbi:MAG: copper chaperone PCu(A)C [Pseudomonadota bacterium]
MFKQLIAAALLAAAPAAFAGSTDHSDHAMMAGDAPMIHDAYARAATPNARAGAAFGVLMNPTDADDTLIAVRSDVAMRVELHTHVDDGNGVMQMREVEGGFAIPAGGEHTLRRGGDHIMFMGLTESFDQGKDIPVTLVFEQAGEVEAVITVDLEREDDHMMQGDHDHGGHDHGAMSN